MSEFDAKFIINFIGAGFKILNVRLLLIITLLLTFSLFAWAMWKGDYMSLAIAATFGVIVFLPIKALETKEKQNERQIET